jgi:hypothetical protein
LYAGIDFNQTKYNKIVSNFGKLGHGARSPFARILEALGYSKTKLEHQKDAQTKKNSMELTEAGNGMFTALFHIQMHLDKGDSNTISDCRHKDLNRIQPIFQQFLSNSRCSPSYGSSC